MDLSMLFKIAARSKSFTAVFAHVRFVSRVNSLVSDEIRYLEGKSLVLLVKKLRYNLDDRTYKVLTYRARGHAFIMSYIM